MRYRPRALIGTDRVPVVVAEARHEHVDHLVSRLVSIADLAAKKSCPSAKMSASTASRSPTVALAGLRPQSTWGRTCSMTARAGAGVALGPLAARVRALVRPGRLIVLSNYADGLRHDVSPLVESPLPLDVPTLGPRCINACHGAVLLPD